MTNPNRQARAAFAGELDLRNASDSLRERFWSKVDVRGADECWEWQAYRKPSGYGQFTLRKGEFYTASRVALALSGVVLEQGECACHSCDNPPCVNPAHLFAGDQSVNTIDCIRKGRGNRVRGGMAPSARLTEEDVRTIRALAHYYGIYAELGRKYGVAANTIRSIRRGTKWKHVQ